MKPSYKIKRFAQTSETNCGPTALAQLFSFYDDGIKPDAVENKTKMTDLGTLDGYLGQTAIKFGYKATITPQNLWAFDPTWFGLPKNDLLARLREFAGTLRDKNVKFSVNGYIGFLEAGGTVAFKTLGVKLLIAKIKKHPVLIGFCSTYIYGETRPNLDKSAYRYGHFVVVDGYSKKTDSFSIVDPYHTITFSKTGRYMVKNERLIEAMFLAEATQDCTILEIRK